jgi:hypothetical protein
MRKNDAFRTENGKSLALPLLKPLAFRDQSTHISWRNHRKKRERRLRARTEEVTRRPRPTSSSSPLAAATTSLSSSPSRAPPPAVATSSSSGTTTVAVSNVRSRTETDEKGLFRKGGTSHPSPALFDSIASRWRGNSTPIVAVAAIPEEGHVFSMDALPSTRGSDIFSSHRGTLRPTRQLFRYGRSAR